MGARVVHINPLHLHKLSTDLSFVDNSGAGVQSGSKHNTGCVAQAQPGLPPRQRMTFARQCGEPEGSLAAAWHAAAASTTGTDSRYSRGGPDHAAHTPPVAYPGRRQGGNGCDYLTTNNARFLAGGSRATRARTDAATVQNVDQAAGARCVR
ncbi:hypothetical protein CBM2637_A30008 [Cupriavidus taiwanensis]|nr:hypothetical protein CBM2637_A30008 [Cupriavidus taiwanensis]